MSTPSFEAFNNAQTGLVSNTPTQLTYPTVNWNVGGYFASNAWTPPSGIVWLNAQAFGSGNGATTRPVSSIFIYKNGSAFAELQRSGCSNGAGEWVFGLDQCNGSDAYTVFGDWTTDSGTTSVTYTYFWGIWIEPAVAGHVRFNMPMLGH